MFHLDLQVLFQEDLHIQNGFVFIFELLVKLNIELWLYFCKGSQPGIYHKEQRKIRVYELFNESN